MVRFALAFALLTTPAYAATLKVPADHETIAAAVAAAEDGDTILVVRGSYDENVLLDGFTGINLKGRGNPVINVQRNGACLEIRNCVGVRSRLLWGVRLRGDRAFFRLHLPGLG